MNIVYICITIIVCVSVLAQALILNRHGRGFETVEELIAREAANTLGLKKQTDSIIGVHNSTVEHYDKEIADIISKLENITADIKRLDAEVKYQQTRMNVVYPWYENSVYRIQNGGVDWAAQYPDQDQEEEHEETE